MEIRKVGVCDIDAAAAVAEVAFEVELGTWKAGWHLTEDVYGPGAIWAVWDGKRYVSTCVAPPQEIRFGGCMVPGGFVGGVATLHDERRKGYAEALMRDVVRDARERGRLISFLWPFSHPYYRKAGWELAGDRILTTLTRETALTLPQTGEVREVRCSDLPEVMALWERFGRVFNCCSGRSEVRWIRFLGNHTAEPVRPDDALITGGTRCIGCWVDGRLAGYAMWVIQEKEPLAFVHEMVHMEPGVLGALARGAVEASAGECERVCWYAPMQNGSHLLLAEPRQATRTVECGFMARFMDAPALLQRIPWSAEAKGILDLHITDPVFGLERFGLEVAAGSACRTGRRGMPLHVDVQTLTRIALGYMLPLDAVLLGHVQASELSAAVLLSAAADGRQGFRSPAEPG